MVQWLWFSLLMYGWEDRPYDIGGLNICMFHVLPITAPLPLFASISLSPLSNSSEDEKGAKEIEVHWNLETWPAYIASK